MAYSILLHIPGDLPVLGEVEELPKPTDTIIAVSNPRQRDGRTCIIWKPMWSRSFSSGEGRMVEILESQEEEKIIGFVRITCRRKNISTFGKSSIAAASSLWMMRTHGSFYPHESGA